MDLFRMLGIVPIEEYRQLEAKYLRLAEDYRRLNEKHTLLKDEHLALMEQRPKRGKGGRFEKR